MSTYCLMYVKDWQERYWECLTLNQGGSWLSVLGITVANTIWGSALFVLFCLTGIIYLGNQTLQSTECICSWIFLRSFAIALGQKLGILGTSSLIASLFLVTAWELGRNAKEAIMFRWAEQARERERAKGEERGIGIGIGLVFNRLEQEADLPEDVRERIKRLKSELQVTSTRH